MDEDTPDLTLTDFARRRTVILHYDPVTDEVSIDANGCSPLEVRGIVQEAQETLDHTPYPGGGVADPDDDDEE